MTKHSILGLTVLLVAHALACSTDDKSASGGAGGQSTTGGTGGTGGTAGGSTLGGNGGVANTAGNAGTTSSAGNGGNVGNGGSAGAECNTLVLEAQGVTATCAGTTTTPTPAGTGTIPDGIYDTTAVELYAATCSTLASGKETVEISGTTMQMVNDFGGTVQRYTQTLEYVTQGTGAGVSLRAAMTCPQTTGQRQAYYTIAGDTLTIFNLSADPPEVHTLVKR